MSKITAHSEYGTINTLVLKRPRDAFKSQAVLESSWKDLNFLLCPDFEESLLEYEFVEDTIARVNPKIHYLPDSKTTGPDSVYCRDAAISTDFGMILCNMGKSNRENEPEEERKLFESMGIPILGAITGNGTLEGGDVAWIDEKTLAVGHTYRTNYEGISQLKELLEPKGIEVLVAEMPHYRGKSDVFHLMSVLSPVDQFKAVVYSPLMPIHFREELLARNYELIEVPDEEFDSMGSNVLAISPSNVIMVRGNPVTKKRLEENGCQVIEYYGEEVSVKGGGGPTCLTRPITRSI